MNEYQAPSDVLVVVVEGPAGSGKTALLSGFRGAGIIDHRVSKKPWIIGKLREFGVNGPIYSQVNDYDKAVRAISQGPGMIVGVDRLVVSQWVYETLRQEAEPDLHQLTWMMANATRIYERIGSEYAARAFMDLPINVRFLWLIRCPTVSALAELRAQTDKYYPFSAEEEIWLYERAGIILYNHEDYRTALQMNVHLEQYHDGTSFNDFKEIIQEDARKYLSRSGDQEPRSTSG